MIVLDASAAIDLLLRRGAHESVARLVADQDAQSSELLIAEVLHALRRFEHRGELTPERAAQAVDDLVDLPVELWPLAPSTRDVWRVRADVTAYDGVYVVLAAELDAVLVTTDGPLSRTAARYCSVADL